LRKTNAYQLDHASARPLGRSHEEKIQTYRECFDFTNGSRTRRSFAAIGYSAVSVCLALPIVVFRTLWESYAGSPAIVPDAYDFEHVPPLQLEFVTRPGLICPQDGDAIIGVYFVLGIVVLEERKLFALSAHRTAVLGRGVSPSAPGLRRGLVSGSEMRVAGKRPRVPAGESTDGAGCEVSRLGTILVGFGIRGRDIFTAFGAEDGSRAPLPLFLARGIAFQGGHARDTSTSSRLGLSLVARSIGHGWLRPTPWRGLVEDAALLAATSTADTDAQEDQQRKEKGCADDGTDDDASNLSTGEAVIGV
jgi:hypothetical protein